MCRGFFILWFHTSCTYQTCLTKTKQMVKSWKQHSEVLLCWNSKLRNRSFQYMPDLAMEWEARDGYKASRHQFIYAIIFCWQDFFFPVRMNHIVKHTTKHPEKGKKKNARATHRNRIQPYSVTPYNSELQNSNTVSNLPSYCIPDYYNTVIIIISRSTHRVVIMSCVFNYQQGIKALWIAYPFLFTQIILLLPNKGRPKMWKQIAARACQ